MKTQWTTTIGVILLIGNVQGQEVPREDDAARAWHLATMPLPVGKTVPAESKYESYRQEILAGKQKMLDVLKGIADSATASAAIPKLEAICEGTEASWQEHIGDMLVSCKDEARVEKRYEVQSRVIDTALHFEISRLRVLGLLSNDVKAAIEAFASLCVFPEVVYATDPVMAHEQEEVYRRYFYELMAILEEMNVALASVKDTASADAVAVRMTALRDRQKKAEEYLSGRRVSDIARDRVRMPDEYLFSRMQNVWGDELKRIGQNDHFGSSELEEALDGISLSY